MNSASNISLIMPNTLSRLEWEGEEDGLAVLPGDVGASPQGLVPAYGVGADPVDLAIFEQSTAPVLVVSSSTIDFGLNPEDRRSAAPKKHRGTLSNPDEEFGGGVVMNVVEGCEDDPSGPGCEGGGPAGNNTVVPGTSSCWSSSGDADTDGFKDSCEFALAAAFAPELKVQLLDQDATMETYWAASPISSTEIRIFYALGYHRDMGAGAHIGDSEFIVVEGSHRGGETWRTERVYLSAHWGTQISRSEWVSPLNILFAYSRPLAPVVWVAKDKHANYRSLSACNSGTILPDTCFDSPWYWVQATAVLSNANLGRLSDNIVNCVFSRIGAPTYIGQECFWNAQDFTGWYGVASGSTPYQTSLFLFMPN